ncbi:MAG: PBP1A family penicillin-binding protein [Rickettsiales bacterium]|jgi:penicillin-binding protein 1A|nr:PBP1A family penicillin-binding protein [Rickettsiales bacterium]
MLKKVLGLLVRIIYIATLAVIGTLYGLFVYYSRSLPRHSKLEDYQPPITSRVYSSDGLLLREYAEEKRLFVSIENIPDIVKQAFISAEDKNFYRNSGLDLGSLFSAFIYNAYNYYKNRSTNFRGGSTITQQVVKNMLLTKEKTIQRKIKEAILAIRITRDFEKDKILEIYLNHIFLGNNSYGVAAAALTYFDKSLDELTLEDAALLASLPKSPGKINPIKNYSKALERRNWVLQRMKKDDFIDEKKFELAVNEPIKLRKYTKKYEYFNFGAFVEEVKKNMLEKFTEDDLMKKGLMISTTIEPNIQVALDEALKNGLEKYDRRHGYRGALNNIHTTDDANFQSNWPRELKNLEIKEYRRNNWEIAVVLALNREGQQVIIGMLHSPDAKTYDFDTLSTVGGIVVRTSYMAIKNIKWAMEPSALETREIDGAGNEKKILKEAQSIADLNLHVGDVIFVENSDNNSGYFLRQTPLVNGGAVAIDPHSGRILGMVGGYIDSERNFNRVTQANRQPGSAIKPIVYLAAIENNYKLSDTIMDDEIVLSQGPNLPTYRPRNFDGKFHGLVTLRKAIQNSYNVATVRLASQVGLNKIVKTIQRFGINSKPKRLYSVALGSLETHLISLTRSYAMIINGGKYIDITTIEKVQDKYGRVIFRGDGRMCRECVVTEEDANNVEVPFLEDSRPSITDSRSAYQITYLMEGVVKYGTARYVREIGKIVGGKTGTSNDFRDAWFIGCTPDLVIGAYVGFDDNRTLGENEIGSKVAAPIFVEAMREILKNEQSVPFRIPEGITFRKIDMSTGKKPTLATPKNNIVLEAFKTDSVDSTNYDNYEENSNIEQLKELGLYIDDESHPEEQNSQNNQQNNQNSANELRDNGNQTNTNDIDSRNLDNRTKNKDPRGNNEDMININF